MANLTRTPVRLSAALAAGAIALAGCASGSEPEAGATDGAAPTSAATTEPAGGSDGPTETATSEPASEATPTETTPPPPPLQSLALETVAEGLAEPVHATAPAGDDRVYIVERAGAVVVVDPDEGLRPEPLLDIRDRVNSASSIEQGLYSVAFHPDYADNGRLYVMHALPGNDNQVVEYTADPDAATVDTGTARVLLTIDKEADKVRHNGGQLAFGPEGFLFISVGDGARASVNGQDPTTRLGTILRIDVDSGDPYDVPESNPFSDGDGGAPEVWAYGLRNPWRFAIDPVDGLVYIGDVGQETVEEVNLAPLTSSGLNFGWPVKEGDGDFYGGEGHSELTPPALALDHEATPSCSITGGVVYRGAAIPELDGRYFLADWCLGWIKHAVHDGGALTDLTDVSDQLPAQMVSSFGTDGAGEVLVVDYAAGTVSRIVPVR